MNNTKNIFLKSIIFISILRSDLASPEPFIVQQPNGEKITIINKGNHLQGWHEYNGWTITKNNDGIELEIVDTMWQINGHDSLDVKQNSIDKFFDTTVNVKRSSISISENAKDLSIYSLDDSSSVQLIVLNATGDTLGKGIFGINKNNYLSNYYKSFENNKIYKTDSNILSFLTVNSRYWGESPKADVSDSTNIELPIPTTNQ